MSVNVFIPQIAASNAGASSEPAGSLPHRAHRSTEIGSRKIFSTVLHTISRERETELSRKSGDRRPVDASDRADRAERTKAPVGRAARCQQSESQRDKMEESRRPGEDTLKGSNAPRADRESQEGQIRLSESHSSQHHQESESWKNRAEEGSHQEVDMPEAADAPKAGLESWSLGDCACADSHVVLPAPMETLTPVPVTTQSDAVGSGSGEDSDLFGVEQHEGAALQQTPFGLIVKDAGSGVQLALGDVEQTVSDSHAGTRSASSPNGLPLVSRQADLDRTLLSAPAWPLLENMPSSRTSDSVRPAQGVQPERPAPVVAPANMPALLPTDVSETKSLSAMPFDHHTVADGAFQSSLDWSEQGGREQAGNESPLPRHMAAASTSTGFASAMAGEVGTAGTAALSMSRPVESSVVPSPVPAPPVPASRDAGESSLSAASRSVVFEVAQTDLGRINVRVALVNEVVHTYLSSDRAEVGQFLINGQERLQTALQANGLEMGQFRVDIDRQNAGRSFQQGPSHDQGRSWHHGSSQGDEAQVFEARDNRRSWSQGRLNLVV